MLPAGPDHIGAIAHDLAARIAEEVVALEEEGPGMAVLPAAEAGARLKLMLLPRMVMVSGCST